MLSNQHNSKLPSQQTRKGERHESPTKLSNSHCQINSTRPSLSFTNFEINSIDHRKLSKNKQKYSRNSTGSKPLEFIGISPYTKMIKNQINLRKNVKIIRHQLRRLVLTVSRDIINGYQRNCC